jgi:hypothetical protein
MDITTTGIMGIMGTMDITGTITDITMEITDITKTTQLCNMDVMGDKGLLFRWFMLNPTKWVFCNNKEDRLL